MPATLSGAGLSALGLAVACSLAIGMIFKLAARRGMDRLGLLTVNYAAAAALGAALLLADGSGGALHLSSGLLALGVATGALFIGGFFLLALATALSGMALALGVMRLSVVIPFFASWLIWGEVPSPAQGAGLGLAGAAFFLIARRKAPPAQAVGPPGTAPSRASPLAAAGVLALLFLAGGFADVFMKTFDMTFAEESSRALYALLLFSVAFAIGLVLVVGRGLRGHGWPTPSVFAWGTLLGLANYGSVEFILRAIEHLSGPFVFPVNNIAIVMGAALLGVFVWGERLSRVNVLGLALAAVALVLLGM